MSGEKEPVRPGLTNPPTERVEVVWVPDAKKENPVFKGHDRSGYEVLITQPEGINASDMLPLSVAGCAAWDVISILRKQRQKVTGLKVEVSSVRDKEPPWRFREIEIRYLISGQNLDEAKIQRAIKLTEENYCSTMATLRDAVKISSTFEITSSEIS